MPLSVIELQQFSNLSTVMRSCLSPLTALALTAHCSSWLASMVLLTFVTCVCVQWTASLQWPKRVK